MASNSTDSSDSTENASVETFVSALVFNVVLGLFIFFLFCVLRPLNHKTYAPRTYRTAEERRPPPLEKGLFSWILPTLRTPDSVIIERTSLDSYMFLYFMRSTLKLFAVFTILGVGVLVPVNIHGGGTQQGLLTLAIGNVKSGSDLLWIHMVFTILFVLIVFYTILQSVQVYIALRHRCLLSPAHQASAQASTLLITDIPRGECTKSALTRVFSAFPGGVKDIYLPRRVVALEDLVEERDKLAKKLESVLTKYTVTTAKERIKSSDDSAPLLARPTHRTGLLSLVGEKVDSITFYSQELQRLNAEIEKKQSNIRNYPRQGSAFVFFQNQIAAHMAYQSLMHKQPLRMNPRHLEIHPDDVIWSNLNVNPYSRQLRIALSIVITIALVIFWAAPVSFVSSIASLDTLTKIDAFKGLNDLPKEVLGLIQGVLPAIALAVLMMVLPIFLRILSKLEGTVRQSDVELSLVHRYFFFLVVNVFIVSTLAGTIIGAIKPILDDPKNIAYELARSLPKANVYFITYIMLQGLQGASQEILQAAPLVMRRVKRRFLAATPRALVEINSMGKFSWGTTIPKHTLIFVMGLCYSTIAPLILVFILLYFALFYLVYRYQMLYVYDDRSFDTGGLSFPHIIYHMLTGVYIFVLTFLGLMALNKTVARSVIMLVVLILTIVFHIYLKKLYDPLFKVLPIELYQTTMADRDTVPLLPSLAVPRGSLSKHVFDSVLGEDSGNREQYTSPKHIGMSGSHSQTSPVLPGVQSSDSHALTITEAEVLRSHDDSVEVASVANHRRSSAELMDPDEESVADYSAFTKFLFQLAPHCPDYLARFTPCSAAEGTVGINDPNVRNAYLNPALKAASISRVWVPKDATGLVEPLIKDVQTESQARVTVVTDHAFLNDKGWVCVDTYDPSTLEVLAGSEHV
ncbi:phosphate metabolism protein 7 [Dispira simplex]|nr:phosphate metabolism protein 7 [Dispira simplex]